MKPTRALRVIRSTGLALAVLAASGCAKPLEPNDQDLRQSVMDSVRRELTDPKQKPDPILTQRTERVSTLELSTGVLKELEATSGIGSYRNGTQDAIDGIQLTMPNLLGTTQQSVAINLQRAITTAVNNNLNVQFSRLAPAIDEAALVVAQAAFDWIFFTNLSASSIDDQSITFPGVFTPATAPTFDQHTLATTTAGLRRKLDSGGQFTVQQSISYTNYNSTTSFPNPAHAAEIALQFDQPLLRNFGSDVALSEVRLAENSERDKVMQLKAQLLQVITDTESAYWDLVQAHGNLQILRQLLARGDEVRVVLRNRREFDTNPSQYSNSVATVEGRRTQVIRAENALRAASDKLKSLMNDPQLTIGSEVLLLPADQPVDAPLQFSLLDSILTATAKRPEVQRAILAMDSASIRQVVADNQRLPQLDLRAQTKFSALQSSTGEALTDQYTGRLIDYLVSMAYEQPIGNRSAEATYRARRLQRMQSVITYRDVVERIILDIKTALRDVTTNYVLIEQTRAQRLAQAENLRTLMVREQTLQSLTPEFLDLKLRTQQSLAEAELQELLALTQYNSSLAKLYGSTGVSLERNRIKFEVPSAVEDLK